MIAVLPAVIKRDINRWTFEIYVTDTLQAIAENTAVPAAGFSDGKHGKAMTRRWADKDKPVPVETRTPEEVIDHIRKRLEEVSADQRI